MYVIHYSPNHRPKLLLIYQYPCQFLIEMKDSHKDGMTKYYQKMCRGEVTTPVEVTSKLKCSYATNNNPYLLIAPFKMEEAYQQPKIVIYYDVITDKEIETIKKISQPKVIVLIRGTITSLNYSTQTYFYTSLLKILPIT